MCKSRKFIVFEKGFDFLGGEVVGRRQNQGLQYVFSTSSFCQQENISFERHCREKTSDDRL